MIDVELGYHIVALLRVERRRGEIDDAVPEESLILELLLHGVPVLEQEIEESLVAGRAAGQHAEDQVDVRVREVLILVQHGHLQQSDAADVKIKVVLMILNILNYYDIKY